MSALMSHKQIYDDLNFIESVIIWSLRKITLSSPYAIDIRWEFDAVFDINAKDAFFAFNNFASELGQGKRPLRVGSNLWTPITYDENAILSLLSAAQQQNQDLAIAHSRWILGAEDMQYLLLNAALEFTYWCEKCGFLFPCKSYCHEFIRKIPTIKTI